MSGYRPEYIMVSGVRTLITAEICRDKVAELRTQMFDAAMLPDAMGGGRQMVRIDKMRDALAAQLDSWNARLYRMTGGAEGALPGATMIPV